MKKKKRQTILYEWLGTLAYTKQGFLKKLYRAEQVIVVHYERENITQEIAVSRILTGETDNYKESTEVLPSTVNSSKPEGSSISYFPPIQYNNCTVNVFSGQPLHLQLLYVPLFALPKPYFPSPSPSYGPYPYPP